MPGSSFLLRPEEEWSNLDAQPIKIDVPDMEIKKDVVIIINTVTEGAVDRMLAYYYSWRKLNQTVSWMVRFRIFLQNKALGSSNMTLPFGPLRLYELKRAEFYYPDTYRVVSLQIPVNAHSNNLVNC